MRPTLRSNTPSNVHANVHVNVHPSVPANVHPNLPANVHPTLPANVHADAQPSKVLEPSSLSGVGSQLDAIVDGEDEPRATGRISDANLAIVEDAFVKVQELAKDTAAKTKLSPSQVIDLWTSSNQRTHVKANMWNLYGSYFKENQEEELGRLPAGKHNTAVAKMLAD